jgi:hypothetical protein
VTLPWPPLWAPALLEAADPREGAPPLPPPIALADMADPNRTIAQTPIAAETLNMVFAPPLMRQRISAVLTSLRRLGSPISSRNAA